MANSLKSYMDRSRGLIDKALDRHLPAAGREPKALHKAMRYSVFSGGKRIRPIIVLEACNVCALTPHARAGALILASAVEMVHTYSLIHDDLPAMDDDDFRRGKPTTHKKFGEANAILAGDALLTLAFNVISKNLDAATGLAAVKELSEAIGSHGMAGGQALDISYKDKRAGASIRENVNYLKTARLFEASAKLGAIASGADGKKAGVMAVFGRSLGSAFQLIDDIMDGGPRCDIRSGVFKVKGLAEEATCKAISALDMFGSGADRLREIAVFMLNRRT